MKYRYNIYEDVKDFFKENYDQDITNEDIDKMSNHDVLDYYLSWNGIRGYTGTIIGIMEAK